MIIPDEVYRDKLVDWMIRHDIATGGTAQTVDELLEVIGRHIDELKRARESENVE